MPPYIIRISSQKGGVGKTTVAVNLSVALQSMGYNVLLVDSDTSNPSVGFHLGVEKANVGYKNFVTGKANLRSTISVHAPSGVHVLPGLINARPFILTESVERIAVSAFKKTEYQFVVIDTEPGYSGLTKYVDEALLITTPDMPSCSSILRLAREFDVMEVKHNLAINRIRNRGYEIHPKEIEEMYERRILGLLPEDEIVPVSIEEKIPAYLLDRRSKISGSIRTLARHYAVGVGVEPEGDQGGSLSRVSFIDWLLRLFRLV